MVVQVVMNWEGCHLYQFNLGASYTSDSIKLPDEEFEDMHGFGGRRHSEYDSKTTFIKDVLNNSKKAINYIYDFGDNWVHSINSLTKPKEEVLLPVCTDGEGEVPVEDCGGLGGFYICLIYSTLRRTFLKKGAERMVRDGKRGYLPKAFWIQKG
jgi:hypothetical protein